MNAGRKQPDIWTSAELGITDDSLNKQSLIKNLSIPTNESDCEFVDSESEEELGKLLVENLMEKKLI
jgi:electron transfer flavoprotein alpha/beta subunit